MVTIAILPFQRLQLPLLSPYTSRLPTRVLSVMNSPTVVESRSFTHANEDYKVGMTKNWISRAHAVFNNNTGLLLVGAAQIFFSSMDTAVKTLNGIDPPVSTMQVIFARMGITYVCSVTYMVCAGVPDPLFGPKGVRLLLAARGFFGFFGLFGLYYSLRYLSLSDATVLTFVAPMCTAISGSIFLGEKFTLREALAGCVSLVGVVLIARPPLLFGNGDKWPFTDEEPAQHRLIAVGVSLLGVAGATGAYTSIRAIGNRAHPMHAMVSFSTLCLIVSGLWIVFSETPFVIPTRVEWLSLLLMIGIFGFLAQLLLTMGLQREAAGRATIAVYTQIVFATILERIFFHTAPTALSVIGTLLIVSSALYVAVTKSQGGISLPDKDSPLSDPFSRSHGFTSPPRPDIEQSLIRANEDD